MRHKNSHKKRRTKRGYTTFMVVIVFVIMIVFICMKWNGGGITDAMAGIKFYSQTTESDVTEDVAKDITATDSSDDNNVEGSQEVTIVAEEIISPTDYEFQTDEVNISRITLPVDYISQLPELPTGCEVTALTTVLHYLGYAVDKEEMAESYLPKCTTDEGDFWNYFVGDPTNEYSYGCYAAPIVTAANTYLSEMDSDLKAYNYSYCDFATLCNEVGNGNPVILWSTIGLTEPYQTQTWTVNSKTIQWIAPEHCVVLIGYDLDSRTVTLSDPLKGIVTADLDVVILRYYQMRSQAVVIK